MKLLEHFKELSLYPKNAEELKGLILQLAVQGKLTANWRKENPDLELASVLLEKIKKEKERLINENKIKKDKKLSEISEDEIPFDIPYGWVWTRLHNLSSINGGFAFKSSNYVESGARVIRISDFNELGFKNDKVVRYDFNDDLTPYVLEDRNILLAMTGGTVGKSLFVNKVDELMVVNQRVATIKIIKPIYEAYINCVIPTNLIQDVIEEAKNSTNDNISMVDIKNFMIPLPPLEEQKAIVKVVNTLFKEVEQLETLTKERIQVKESFVVSALTRLTEEENTQQEWNLLQQHFSSFFTEKKNIKSLRQTVLQLAIQGKLTESWRANSPNIEPASELLKRIEAKKQQLIADKKIKKEKPLTPVEEDEMPYELPEGWVWKRMGDICIKIIDGSHNPPPKQIVGIPMLSAKNVRNGILTWETNRYISKDDFKLEQKRNDILKNDVFLTIVGTIGRTYVVTGKEDEFAIQRSISQIRSSMNPYYLSYLLRSEYMFSYYERNAKGTAQKGIYLNKLKSAPIALPSLEEQKAIVEKVNSLMSLCDELDQQIETSQTQIDQLMQSCLKEVFEYESN